MADGTVKMGQVDGARVRTLTERHVMNTYRRLPLVLVRGEGSWVWDADGRRYLDFVTGLAVTGVGHAHPAVTAAIAAQAQVLGHVSNLYHSAPQAELAARLARLSGLGRVFFCNSGAEANEAALKLARRWAWQRAGAAQAKGPVPHVVLAAARSFHGRTYGAMSLTGQAKYQEGFAPLVPGIVHVPLNDVAALEAAFTPEVCAVLLEPVQGEGGVYPCTEEYLQAARRLCDERGALLMLDEVQTGLGRTGKMFAFQHYGIVPDVLTLAKALGGGLPLGATLAREEVAEAFVPGTHASTFGGNPICCAAGLAVLDLLEREDLSGRAARLGQRLVEGLLSLGRRNPKVGEVRGLGLMVGVDIGEEASAVAAACREKGLLVNAVGDHTLRFLPPLTATDEEVDLALSLLEQALDWR
ncbi:MAG: acetylornithine transaminase [Bacillota bacterium]|nr:acetylornithine transaminase [Bacillota bacterium]